MNISVPIISTSDISSKSSGTRTFTYFEISVVGINLVSEISRTDCGQICFGLSVEEYTLKCPSIGTPKTINFPFVPNGKLIILGVSIFKHID